MYIAALNYLNIYKKYAKEKVGQNKRFSRFALNGQRAKVGEFRFQFVS